MVKFNKIPILLVSCVVVITLAFLIWFMSSKVSENKSNISLSELYEINIYGTEGEGYVEVNFNEDYVKNIKYLKEDGSKLTAADFSYSISKENNLYNDDRFTFDIINAKELAKMGIIFDEVSITYKVTGLKEGIDFDIFKDLKIVIDDNDILLDNSGCSNFVKDNVIFYIKGAEVAYKEGDTVVVGSHVDMNAATDNGYNIKVKEKEFIISEQETTND